jgi:hypothetical protein
MFRLPISGKSVEVRSCLCVCVCVCGASKMLQKTNLSVVTVYLVIIPFRNVSFKHCVTEDPQTVTQNCRQMAGEISFRLRDTKCSEKKRVEVELSLL